MVNKGNSINGNGFMWLNRQLPNCMEASGGISSKPTRRLIEISSNEDNRYNANRNY